MNKCTNLLTAARTRLLDAETMLQRVMAGRCLATQFLKKYVGRIGF